MSSRLIAKNLPDKITEVRLRELFSCQGGEITDVKLCYTKKGVFRKFGFVGYKSSKDAEVALSFLNKTFIDTNKIDVEICKDLGDPSVPRPWSKYAEDSSAFQRRTKEVTDRKELIKKLQDHNPDDGKKKETKDKRPKKVLKELEDVADDPGFQEFLAAHENKTKKQLWTNENIANNAVLDEKKDKPTKSKRVDKEIYEGDSSDNETDGEAGNEMLIDQENKTEKKENSDNKDTLEESIQKPKKATSDLDWLKSKVTKTTGESTASEDVTEDDTRKRHSSVSDNEGLFDESSENKEENEGDKKQKKKIKKKKKKSLQDKEISPDKMSDIKSRTIKMRGIPFKSTVEDIINFFKPLRVEDIRFQRNDKRKPTGYAFVDFQTLEDARNALKKDQANMKGRYVELFLVHNKKDDEELGEKKWQKKGDVETAESVADTGRLFIRNLSYTCTEEDLEELFSKYGPLVEVNLPVDKNSNKSTGFAFVTFMMPEHAVKALSELDGKIFQGRLMHLMPGKTKKTKEEEDAKGSTSSFKRKKEEQQKQLSGSSHNWNTLFLGHNAVAEVMAARMNTTKHDVLDSETKGSVAVRMALGETELVTETREFLETQGVKLDVFGQANSARSKTVILAKNLPPGTTAEELKEIFEKHGDLGRVLMPPFGITAIIEFFQSKDAKDAFSNLAYSKFKHTPLYLEWAPVDVLSGEMKSKKEDEEKEENESDASEDESESGTTLFVKNLNFDTTEETLRQRFESCGKLKSVTVAKKKDARKPNVLLSMGYGFIEFKKPEGVSKAIKLLQNCEVDGHKLELKKSNRETIAPKASRKRTVEKKQTSTKIIVRNIPFEATSKEIRELFSSFGTLKTVRLPKKMVGTGSHRGFAFVDFSTKQEAKRAFKALCQSTHLYGRRLVLEWAEEEDSVELLRQKTAQHYHDSGEPHTKKKKSDLLSSLERTSAESKEDDD